jgi:hypothetical protein
LPIIGIKYLTQLFTAVLLKGYFLAQCKVAQIILILKRGKPPNELTSYRSISLLSIVSKMKANESKLIHVTFTTRRETCPPVHINNVQLSQEDVKYLRLHLDRRLTWHKHIFAKQKQLGITITKMYWLLGRKSKLSTSNKLLIYKTILKPIWTYGIQLWGTAYISNIGILECFQSKALCMIVDAPWYVPNMVIQRDLQIPTIKEEICHYSSQYSARLSAHPNDLTVNLTELSDNRQLRRHLPNDPPARFLV